MTLSIEVAFRSLCLGSSAVVALIGQRFAPHSQSQQTVPPYVVYSRISGDHQRHLGGASGLVFARLQLDIYADAELTVLAIAEALRMRVDGYRGTVTVGSDSIEFQQVALVDELSNDEKPTDGSDGGPQHYRLDFRISALEPVPTLT